MDAFFKTHAYLVEHTNAPVRRALMDEINWDDRMIGIKGTRGIGKTTFLLQYAKEHFNVADKKCLYINMNNFYFQGREEVAKYGPFKIHGERQIMTEMDNLLRSFVASGRMKLGGEQYTPCYELVETD